MSKKSNFIDLMDDLIECFDETLILEIQIIINFKKTTFSLTFEFIEELIEFRDSIFHNYSDNLIYYNENDLTSKKIVYYSFY